MSISVNKIYPKVFKSNASQKIFIRLSEQVEETLLSIKVQPMEKYSVPHTPAYRIDEEERYSYQPLNSCGDGVYCTEYAVLCRAHADAIAKGAEALISVAEKNIKAFNGRFFNV